MKCGLYFVNEKQLHGLRIKQMQLYSVFEMNTEIMDMTLIMIMNTVNSRHTRGLNCGYATMQKVKVILFKIK